MPNTYTSFLVAALSMVTAARAQTGDFAYVEPADAAQHVPEASITIEHGVEPGLLKVGLAPGVTQLDVLNAKGKVVLTMPATRTLALDLRRFSSGNYVLRAHAPQGLRVKRISLLR
jgi:hypothetical protein